MKPLLILGTCFKEFFVLWDSRLLLYDHILWWIHFLKQGNKGLGKQLHIFPQKDKVKVMVMSDHVVMIMAI